MGGKRSAPSAPKPKPDQSAETLKLLMAQQEQQAKIAAEAQRQALIQQQNVAGEQAMQQGEMAARQQLSTMGSMQALRDANALAAAQQAQTGAGQQVTGGGFDIGAQRQSALSALGAAGPTIPQTPANVPTMQGMPIGANQGVGGTSNRANLYGAPSNLQFGGS